MTKPEPQKGRDLQLKQRDVLRSLKRAGANGFLIAQLKKCKTTRCGAAKCRAACVFGANRRDEADVLAAIKLLKRHGGPVFEIRLSHQHWSLDSDNLSEVTLDAIKKMNRRCLDQLYNSTVVAVGMIKASVSSEESDRWKVSLHQIVAGVSRDDLHRVFAARQWKKMQRSIVVDSVKDLDETVARIFEQRFERSDDWLMPSELPLSTAARQKYLLWLLSLEARGLVVRYGCDRYYKPLNKRSKLPPSPKPNKRRPFPYWLQPWFFGSETREKMEETKAMDAYYNSLARKRQP